jgi:hypothetical protein
LWLFEGLFSSRERRAPELFVVGWGEHVQGRVAALAVVEGLDVLEHGGLELEPGRPAAAVDELLLERGEEALGDALSYASPSEPIEIAIPAWRAARPNARLTYWPGSRGPCNYVRGPRKDGIAIDSVPKRTVLRRNHVFGAGDDGFDVQSRTTKLSRNRAVGNADLGIEAVRGLIDGGGNRASGNGNPLECTNVFCA